MEREREEIKREPVELVFPEPLIGDPSNPLFDIDILRTYKYE